MASEGRIAGKKELTTKNVVFKYDILEVVLQSDLPLYSAIETDSVDSVSILIDAGFDPSTDNNICIDHAINRGYFRMVWILLKDIRVNPCNVRNNMFTCTARNVGHVEVVRLLLNDGRLDPSINNNKALIDACNGEQVEYVRLLLEDPRVDPKARDSDPVRAVYTRNYDCFSTW